MFTDINGVELQSGDYVRVPHNSDRAFSVGKVNINGSTVRWADASGGCSCFLSSDAGREEDLSTLEKATEAEYNVAKAMYDKLDAQHSKEIDVIYADVQNDIDVEVKYQAEIFERRQARAVEAARSEVLSAVATLLGTDKDRIEALTKLDASQIDVLLNPVPVVAAITVGPVDDDDEDDEEFYDDGEFEDDEDEDDELFAETHVG